MDTTSFAPEQSGIPLVPWVSIQGITTGTQFAQTNGPGRYHELTADIQKVHGGHTLSAGLLFFHIHAYDNGWGAALGFTSSGSSAIYGGASDENSSATGAGLASMLLNLPNNYLVFFGNTGADIKEDWIGAYVQDKWQVSRKLNLQYGIRWDFDEPPHYKNNLFDMWNMNCQQGNFSTPAAIRQAQENCLLMPIPYITPATPTDPNPPISPVPNVRTSLWDPRYNGWQPRFGFSYNPMAKTVIHGAFAVFDDHNGYMMEMQDPRGSWPFSGNAFLGGYNLAVPNLSLTDLPSGDSFLSGPPVVGRAANNRQKIPYSMQWNFGFQQQFTPNMSLDVSYVGSGDRHLWGVRDYNQPPESMLGPTSFPDAEPFPFLQGIIQGDDDIFTGNYDALQVKVDRRFSQGLSLLGSYTWSKCLDEFSGQFESHPQNTYNLASSYSECDYNFPHLFSFSYFYRLPYGRGMHYGGNASGVTNAVLGGWNLSGVTSAHNGENFDVQSGVNTANNGGTQFANAVPGCQLAPSGFTQNSSHWYNPNCFAIPNAYTYGAAPRDGYRGPGALDFDFSLYKDFKLTETTTLQFRAEGFNIFNRENLFAPGAPSAAVGPFTSSGIGGTIITSVGTPSFMNIIGATDPREIQFALKLVF